ncbi:C-type lectin domain family 6 member A-like [Mya arenaria]|uniref:C-type lectin domain family 6 member A-like n=1 Tax=Mya arenaria TaxID=6604 RepID=UPI0022E001CF|nr:C-type lectin domain family 6 member A-like [Mya arenaria]
MGFQYSCYTLTNASNGFHHDECVTMGAHAVYVESIEEQNFLTNTLSPATGGDELYLGYKKINNILYLAGTLTLSPFTYFGPWEGTKTNEECVILRKTGWIDHLCGRNTKTICEIEL